jgi:hypothetical protein
MCDREVSSRARGWEDGGMNDNIKIALAILGVAIGIYLAGAYFFSLLNTANMSCPNGMHVVPDPWTLAATGRCEQ